MKPTLTALSWTLSSMLVMIATAIPAAASDDSPGPQTLPGTRALTMEGDLASELVSGVDRFLLRKLEQSKTDRETFWNRDLSSPEAYSRSIEPNRARLAHILGVRDPRVTNTEPKFIASPSRSSMLGHGQGYEIHAIRWPAFGDVHGEGLLLLPTGREPVASVVAIPDADISPEALAGLVAGAGPETQFARKLVEAGCRVVVPRLIDRAMERRNGRAMLTNREYLYRPAFVLGRHLIGYEIQEVLAVVDWFEKDVRKGQSSRIGVFGHGEGGLVALRAGALDPRISVVGVSGYFGDRQDVWQEPIDRNVFGLLERFGDAEVAAMIAPRALIVEASQGPIFEVKPGLGGGPGRLVTPDLASVRAEVERARQITTKLSPSPVIALIESGDGSGPFGSDEAVSSFLGELAPGAGLASKSEPPHAEGNVPDAREAIAHHRHEIDRHNQETLAASASVRKAYFAKLDTRTPESFRETIEPYRASFGTDVIGRFDDPKLSPDPRSRKIFDEPTTVGYEVVLDVFPDVIAYGILVLPKDIKPGERRPVVVCQHGLEGRPQDVADPKVNNPSYNQFALRLAERGFITFAPQNLYIFKDRFRTLQRKANPLGKTLFSVIVPQHEQITSWLKSLPFVDPERIAFYGLSYGGKSAMRIPPLVPDYCLSICSADFNEWVWKNASTRSPYSYVWTDEYEIFEFDLGSTFNYAEMASLIAPRPFMVERGHFDGVAPDEMVGYEFAKVREFYEARLGLRGMCEIEWFVGPHTIHGVGTFDFLHKHLRWPGPQAPSR